jgi:pimeloyl-ACP methyl ester carboxylesterase
MTIRWRALAVLALAATAITSAAAAAEPPRLTPELAADYLQPHQLVDVGGGRKLNLYCMGAGSRTVLFDAGLSDWSVIWGLVQPAVAAHARACTYDRAGLGFSDAPKGSRSPVAIVQDMHALVHAAKLPTPLVIVGHSLGGFNMKLYAALYPEDVAGIVLVDPSEERAYDRSREFLRRRYGAALAARVELLDLSDMTDGVTHFNDCAAAARVHDLDPASKTYRECTDPVRGALGPEIHKERVKHQVTAVYQATVASEFANSVYGDDRGDHLYAALFSGRPFGGKPLIVLTHGVFDKDDPVDAAGFASWNELHRQTATLSSRGVNRIIPGTHHNIEIDAPGSIVEAIDQVLSQLDGDRPPK